MQLLEAICAAGMTPPKSLVEGRWTRFPGAGKSRANRAGWCKLITPTLAIYGDWSTGLSEVWRDETHHDDARSARLLAEARQRQRAVAAQDARRAKIVEAEAQRMLDEAKQDGHPYLASKGFKYMLGLIREGELLIPVRAVEDYRLISLQKISADGTKRFLPGGRTRGGVHRLGPSRVERIALCEGLATGLSVQAATNLLPGPWAVVICFSAMNLVLVSDAFSSAIVCADNDESGTGEKAARDTALKWVMPPQVGEDFNDMHRRLGLIHVVEKIREAL